MATTIQVSDESREDLLIIKARLEQQTGKKHTLDDAIKWLIAKSRSKNLETRKKAGKKLLQLSASLNVSLEDMTKLRQTRSSRFADF